MSYEDFMAQKAQTMTKFDPSNKNHAEYLTYSREAMGHTVLQTMEWMRSMGVIINPSQC